MGSIPPVPQRPATRSVRKALLWILCLLILLAGITAFLLYRAAGAAPDWYVPPAPLAASQPARDAEDIVIDIQTWAGARYAWDYARARNPNHPAPPEPDQRLTITLADDQVNALLQKWFPIYGKSIIGNKPLQDTLRDPMVHFSPGQITVAATLLDMDSRTLSLDLRPQVLPDGTLSLNLSAIRAGTLHLPEFAWSRLRDQWVGDLSRALPALRAKAAIDPGGGANPACTAAIAATQTIATLQHRPTLNVLLLPIVSHNLALPVQIEAIEIQDGTLTVTIRAMTPDQRQQLLTHVRNGPAD